VSNFLNLHSLGNHEDFCLAYVFTYRDFTGGTLGMDRFFFVHTVCNIMPTFHYRLSMGSVS